MNKAPILITIGPQCAGKTTFINNLSQRTPTIDVTIDDEADVYHDVPVESLQILLYNKNVDNNEYYSSVLWNEEFHPTLAERFMNPNNLEQRLIFELFFAKEMGTSSYSDMIQLTSYKLRQALRQRSATAVLVSILEELLPQYTWTSPTISLFAHEAIPNAVNRALQRFSDYILPRRNTQSVPCIGESDDQSHIYDHTCICWGNTNLNPAHYQTILQYAQEAGRPVRFIRWKRELPFVPFEELVKRNIVRFLQTGKYIPILTLQKCLQSANELIDAFGGADSCFHSNCTIGTDFELDELGFVFRRPWYPPSGTNKNMRREILPPLPHASQQQPNLDDPDSAQPPVHFIWENWTNESNVEF